MTQDVKKRILTGDRPTGDLHLGHYVGSLSNRVKLQDRYDCCFIIANLHTLTTKKKKEDILAMRENIRSMVADYLACGIDPEKSLIYLQSEVPAVYEMNTIFSMLVSLNRLTGLPSLKDMARSAQMDEESIPFGLIGYPVLMTADILMPRAHVVPVGKDNTSHIEVARDIARRFNQYYGEVFPIPEMVEGEVPTLVGTDGKGKMSKSLGNAILLSEEEKSLEKKVKKMYTDPNRVRADIPGTVEGNPVFIYLDAFCREQDTVEELKKRYREGNVSDVEVKGVLFDSLNTFLKPIREKRKEILAQKGYVEKVIKEGTEKMREIAGETLKDMRSAMGMSGTWKKIERLAKEC